MERAKRYIPNSTSCVMPKRTLQALLTKARKAGFDVDKTHSGRYTVMEGEVMILSALNGYRSYLVRYSRDYFKCFSSNEVAPEPK